MTGPPVLVDAATVELLTGDLRVLDRVCVAVGDVLMQIAAGQAVSSNRQLATLAGVGTLGLMAGVTGAPAVAAKVVFIPEVATAVSHPGVVATFDPASGEMRSLFDAHSLTALRTAATTLVATRRLAPAARSMCIVGTGAQARAHVRMFRSMWPELRLCVVGRDASSLDRLRVDDRNVGSPGPATIPAVATTTDLGALAAADVVTSLTSARTPFLLRRHVRDDAQINAVGASLPGLREWHDDVVLRGGTVVCDDIEECRRQSGELDDLALARARSLPEVYAGEDVVCPVLYKSVGLGALDAAVAAALTAHDWFGGQGGS